MFKSILKFDFAGTHGTAWGAINLWLTVVTLTTCAHVFASASWWAAGVLAGVGFVSTLGWAVFRKRPAPPVTVLYQLVCWVGSGLWSAWMLTRADWNVSSWLTGVVGLAAASAVAGVVFALGREETPVVEQLPAQEEDIDGLSRTDRNALGDRWAMRINRLAGNPLPVPTPGKPAPAWVSLVKFSALVEWPTGCGYTLEGTFTSGAFGLPQLQLLADKLSLDANLPYGCGVRAYEHGGKDAGRRDFLLDVTSKNALLEEQPFPVEGGPWSANGGVPLGAQQNGESYFYHQRQKNIAVYGAPGSGKTGTMKELACALAYTADCVTVGIDATGGDLVRPMLVPWEEGRADHPAFAAVAVSYEEGERLTRAQVRIGHARKQAYQALMREHNTTLIPIGATVRRADLSDAAREHFPHPDDHERIVPQIMCLSDETREFLCSSGSQPVLRQWITQGMRELRGAGIRYAFGPLGTSNANIDQSIQNLVHTNVAMLLATSSEYVGALGPRSGVTLADFPNDPNGTGKLKGIGFASADPGVPPVQIRMHGEMRPDIVDKVAVRASQMGWLPELDYVSELAANGFMPDGSPWPVKRGSEMEESDRWFWRDRWANWGARRLQSEEEDGAVPLTAPAPQMGTTAVRDRMDALRQKVAETEKKVEERANAAVEESPAVDEAELARIVEQWIAVAEDAAPPAAEPWRERVLRAIRNAGSNGVQAKELIELAGVHRSEVYKFLTPLVKEGKIVRSSSGYSIPPDER